MASSFAPDLPDSGYADRSPDPEMILLVGVGGPRGCTVAHLEEVRHDLIRRVPDSSAITGGLRH
jgi:hypothetical protein